MKKLLLSLFALLLALLVLPGFQTAQAASSSLSGTSWVLSSFNGQLPLPGTPITRHNLAGDGLQQRPRGGRQRAAWH